MGKDEYRLGRLAMLEVPSAQGSLRKLESCPGFAGIGVLTGIMLLARRRDLSTAPAAECLLPDHSQARSRRKYIASDVSSITTGRLHTNVVLGMLSRCERGVLRPFLTGLVLITLYSAAAQALSA